MTDTLLPPNATRAERALEASTARVSSVPVTVRQSWNPDTCPAAMLPWLAWAFSVDEWDANWTEEVKREVIRAAYDVHRVKGTVYAVRRTLASIGFGDVTIDEGRHRKKYDGSVQYDGFPVYGDPAGWAYYRVRFPKLLSTAQANQARQLLATNAPARSAIWSLDFTAATLIYNAFAKYDGTYKHGVVQ